MRLPDRHEPDPARPTSAGSTSLGDALAWLDRHINLERIESGLAGRSALPTLERIEALLGLMGEPQLSFPALQVTGTNGKGSTTWMSSALLQANGLSVGTYTSPDLERLNERISRDGEEISDDALAGVLGALWELERFMLTREPDALRPTWFELITAAAFRYFADEAVDAAVFEVGIGGRWDATNVANGIVSAITNVDLDHVEILGPTRADIAREKAGIIKAGAVAVIGEEDPEIVEIFLREAEEVGAESVLQRGRDFACVTNVVAHGGRLVGLRTPGGYYEDIFVPLHGAHQGENAAIALCAAEAFFATALDRSVVEDAFAAVRVPARLEVVSRQPLVLLDGAHNPAGAAVLGAALAEDFAAATGIIVVLGCLRGRDPREMLVALDTGRISQVIACRPPSPRSMDPARIYEAATELGLPVSIVEEVEDAVRVAEAAARADDLVLVTGSLYTVGVARARARALGSLRP